MGPIETTACDYHLEPRFRCNKAHGLVAGRDRITGHREKISCKKGPSDASQNFDPSSQPTQTGELKIKPSASGNEVDGISGRRDDPGDA